MANQAHDFVKDLAFGYFDAIVLVWLVVGFLRGRKHGMTQEILPMFQWVAIVLLGGYFNQPVGALIREYSAPGAFSDLWSSIMGYGVIALGTLLFFALLKNWLGDKLTGSDLFGRFEYYLGIMAGVARFGCILLVLLAVMHSRIVTQPELDAIDAKMHKNFDDIHPPGYDYGCIEQAIFTQSFVGRTVQDNLPDILIPTFAPPASTNADSLKKKMQDAIDNTMAPAKKQT
jgi:uncharacterized membrane protein required for colicin V production